MLAKYRLSSIIDISKGDIMSKYGSIFLITICLIFASCGGGGGGSTSSSVGSSGSASSSGSGSGSGSGSSSGSSSGTGSGGSGSTGGNSSNINPADYVLPTKVEAIAVE